MEPERLRAVRALGIVVVVMTFMLMVLGSWVKATGSGLACPDWPRCYGEWMPPFPSADNGGTYQGEPVVYSQAQVLYEWGHRGLAMVTGLVVLAFAAIVALKGKELHPMARSLPMLAILVLVIQVLLGGITVLGKNAAPLTTAHLATATLFFFLVTLATAFLYLRPFPEARAAKARHGVPAHAPQERSVPHDRAVPPAATPSDKPRPTPEVGWPGEQARTVRFPGEDKP